MAEDILQLHAINYRIEAAKAAVAEAIRAHPGLPSDIKAELESLVSSSRLTPNTLDSVLSKITQIVQANDLRESFNRGLQNLIAQEQKEIAARKELMSAITSAEFVDANTTYSASNPTAIYNDNGTLRLNELTIINEDDPLVVSARTNGTTLATDDGTPIIIRRANNSGNETRYYTIVNGQDVNVYDTQAGLTTSLGNLQTDHGAILDDDRTPAPDRLRQAAVLEQRAVLQLRAAGVPQERINNSFREFGIRTMSEEEMRGALGFRTFAVGAGVPTPEPAPIPSTQNTVNIAFDIANSKGEAVRDGRIDDGDAVALANAMDTSRDGSVSREEVRAFLEAQNDPAIKNNIAALANTLRDAGVFRDVKITQETPDDTAIAMGLNKRLEENKDRSAAGAGR
ncbi:MAG: hypothetical protein ACOYJ2_07370 [Rickettsiales bacterium]